MISTAIWGLPGYAFLGIHKEVRKLFGSSVMNYVISARIAQGFEDAQKATLEERQYIVNRWQEHKDDYQSTKKKGDEDAGGHESGQRSPRGFFRTKHLSFEERKKLHAERKAMREEERNKVQNQHGSRTCPFCRRENSHTHTPRPILLTPVATQDEPPSLEFEHAIHASVAATSQGNPEEDLVIERAIRASLRELQNTPGSLLSDQEAMNRAIHASIAEAERNAGRGTTDLSAEEEQEHEALLEKAIQQSLLEYRFKSPSDGSTPQISEDVDTDDDENVKLAIQMSKEDALDPETTTSGMAKENIVLDYVKQQSLAEEKHKQAVLGKQKAPAPSSSSADEEALKLAIEESMKSAGGSASGS